MKYFQKPAKVAKSQKMLYVKHHHVDDESILLV